MSKLEILIEDFNTFEEYQARSEFYKTDDMDSILNLFFITELHKGSGSGSVYRQTKTIDDDLLNYSLFGLNAIKT